MSDELTDGEKWTPRQLAKYLEENPDVRVEIDKILHELHCCEGWSSYESEINGKCPDCGMPTVDGHAAYGCYYSPVSCETCGHCICDGSC